jgi:hypothetical protein
MAIVGGGICNASTSISRTNPIGVEHHGGEWD